MDAASVALRVGHGRDRLLDALSPRAIALSALRANGRPALLSVGGGVGLSLAFPGVDWSAAAWVALTPVIYVAVRTRPRVALVWGWVAGSAFFLVLLRWLEFTVRVYSAIPWPFTWLLVLLLAFYCAVYVGLFAGGVSKIAQARGPLPALLVAPFLWVATEWVRGELMGGFPWGSLGYSQYQRLEIIQIAELGGVHAVSLLLLAVNAALAGGALLRWRHALVGLSLALLLVAAAVAFGLWRLGTPAPPGNVRVAIVQPAIEQRLKWDERYAASTLAIYRQLTRRAAGAGADLIVWPETASPTLLRRDPELLASLRETSADSAAALVVGSLDIDDESRVRNSAFLVTDRGIVGRYDKMHLVPFGEYIPLAGMLGFVKDWAEFVSELEPGSRPVVFRGPPAPVAVVICYEGAFPGLVRRFVTAGAGLLVNLSNDGWFGRTSGPLQHLAMYPFRAVEHRAAVVRAANTGVSAIIAPTGQIVQRLALYEQGVVLAPVSIRQQTTLYTRLGDWLAYVSLAVTAFAIVPTRRMATRSAPQPRR
jgi:apolipoprotein N-acyltransferase